MSATPPDDKGKKYFQIVLFCLQILLLYQKQIGLYY